MKPTSVKDMDSSTLPWALELPYFPSFLVILVSAHLNSTKFALRTGSHLREIM